jgi:hypothetical protein
VPARILKQPRNFGRRNPTSKPLPEQINDVLVKYLERKIQAAEPIGVPEMAIEMTVSLVDMIIEQYEPTSPLLSQIVATLGDEYLQATRADSERHDN